MTQAYSTREVESRWRAARRVVVLVLLVAVPLVFDPTVWPPFALPKFTVAALGALVALALTVAERLVQQTPARWRTGLSLPVLLVVGWTAVSAVASSDPATSVFGSRESFNGLATTTVFAVVFLAVAGAFDASHVRTALSMLWFGSGSAVLLYGAVQLREWDPVPWVPFADVGLIWSTLGNPNDLGGFLAIILPIGLVLLVVTRQPLARAVTVGLIVLLVIELAVIGSRGAALAAVVALVALAASLRHRLVLALVAVLVTVCIALAVGDGGETPGTPLNADQGSTVSLRFELWESAWRMGIENPIFGVGPDGFAASFDTFRTREFEDVYGPELVGTDAHNLLLTRLGEQGFPGAFVLLMMLGCALALFLKAGPRVAASPPTEDAYPLFVAVCAGLLAYVVQAMFNRHDIALEFCFWVLLGLACALAQASGGPAGSQEGGQGNEGGDRPQP